MEWNDPVVGQKLHFNPLPLKKINKRGGKPTFTKSAFQNPGWYGIISKSSCLVLGWKGALVGAWWPVLWNSVPKFELDFCPDHWVGPFGPKLHLVISFKLICIKKVTFQDICSVNSLWKFIPISFKIWAIILVGGRPLISNHLTPIENPFFISPGRMLCGIASIRWYGIQNHILS